MFKGRVRTVARPRKYEDRAVGTHNDRAHIRTGTFNFIAMP